MKPGNREPKIRMKGEDVAYLHKESGRLGSDNPEEEVAQVRFGPGTVAVTTFQQRRGSEPNAVVDERTAELIAREVEMSARDKPLDELTRLQLLKVAALYLGKQCGLKLVGASWVSPRLGSPRPRGYRATEGLGHSAESDPSGCPSDVCRPDDRTPIAHPAGA